MYRLLICAFLLAVACSHPAGKVPQDFTKLARSLVHKASWAAFGTISTEEDLVGYPMVNVISIADNDINEDFKHGEIFFMLMDIDYSGKDWKENNKVTLLFSDDQNGDCTNNNREPMGHSCPRVHISGQVEKLDDKSDSFSKALDIFLNRHPQMKRVVGNSEVSAVHGFYLCKLKIQKITVQPSNQNVDVNNYYGFKLNLNE